MKTKKHLFNGSIWPEDGVFVAKDMKEKYITYGTTLEHCQREVFAHLTKLFINTPFIIEYYPKTGHTNFSAYKRGKL